MLTRLEMRLVLLVWRLRVRLVRARRRHELDEVLLFKPWHACDAGLHGGVGRVLVNLLTALAHDVLTRARRQVLERSAGLLGSRHGRD